MDAVGIALVMFLAVVAGGLIVRALPVPIPLPLVQIALGALIAGVFDHGVRLESELFFLLFLPPLLFLDGWRIPKEGLLRDKASILELAFGLVFFTVLGLGYLIHWMIPAMPLPVAFALAAIVSPTDPVAVSAITSRVPMPRRMMHVLEGESLLNDASGLVAFRFAVAAALTGTFSLFDAAVSFLWVAIGGVVIGFAFTWAVGLTKTEFSRRFGEETGSEVLVSLLIPYGAYLLAEHAGASGILAAVSAGVTMSYAEMSGRVLAATRMQRAAFWNTAQFALNGIMFVLLGEQLPAIWEGAVQVVRETGHENPWWLLLYTLAINVTLAALRFAWVWVSLKLGRASAVRHGEQPTPMDPRLVLVVSIAGVRGAITLAGVLTLPVMLNDEMPFPARDLAIFLAATVIIVSLVGASVILPRLLAGLEVPPEAEHHRQQDLANQGAAEAGLKAVDRSLHRMVAADPDGDPKVYTAVANRLMDSLAPSRGDGAAGEIDAELVRREQAIEREMRLAALRASRDELFRMARAGQISDDIVREAVRRIDLQEARLQ